MTQNRQCTSCQADLPEEAPGNRCPKCILELGLEDSSSASERNSPPAGPSPPQEGECIGRYKLLQQIGEGGCGVVYMAEQEEPVRRRVALKVIKLGMDTKTVIARFEAERQALAMMDHPNIARVFDGGASETGRPYFVMELVRGIRITEYCDQHKLSTHERLELFTQVCQAVQHAHQKGIIHRDLKPSNILVTVNDGIAVPKVIDFGVAKATEQRLTDKTLFTRFESFIGTPAYMSPEQAEMSSLDIDTRSDIYSLGVLLYELLTGQTPFDARTLQESGLEAMRRTIREVEPARPSTRLRTLAGGQLTTTAEQRQTDSSRLISTLRGDLDWIVMKCLEKDRTRRYEAANSLAADVQRHLSNEPVVARPPSAAYRFQKLVRRNQRTFVAAAIIGIVFLVAAIASIGQAIRATRAERNARAQAERAQTIKDFLTEQFLALNPYVDPKPDPSRRALLERVSRAVDTKFINQPLVEAELRLALAPAFLNVLDLTNCVAQLERAFKMRHSILRWEHSDTLWAAAWLTEGYYLQGQHSKAKKLLNEALGAARSAPDSLSLGGAEVVFEQGQIFRWEERFAEGLDCMRESIAVIKKSADPNDFNLQNKLWKLAYLTTAAGRWEEAEQLWLEQIQQCQQNCGAEHPLTAQNQKGYAYLLLQRGLWAKAIPILERIIPVYHRTLGTNHNNGLDAENLLGEAYDKAGRIEDAAQVFASLYPRWVPHLPYDAARTKCNIIATFFVRHRQFAQAKAVFESLRESYEANPPELPGDFEKLIEATAAMKGWPAAARVCRTHLDGFASVPAACRAMATVFQYCGDQGGYRQVLTKAFALAPTLKRWPEQQEILNVAVLGTNTLSPEQVTMCEALIQSGEKALATATEDQQNSIHRLFGALLLRLGRLTNSLDHLDKAAQKYPSGINRARVLVLRALCLHALGGTEKARAAFTEAEVMMKTRLLDRLSEFESFLSRDERTYLILHREAEALLLTSTPRR